jgi:hypothetical protein
MKRAVPPYNGVHKKFKLKDFNLEVDRKRQCNGGWWFVDLIVITII